MKEQMKTLLKFGKGNAKLSGETYTFSLPAGWSCPGASACLARVGPEGKIQDGPKARIRCFAASMEARRPNVRASRERNFALLRAAGSLAAMRDLILASLPSRALLVRAGVSGDFFSEDYFCAWLEVARARPQTIFYAYTKSLRYWIDHLDAIPPNFKLTASKGGRYDALIAQYGLKYAEVVFSEKQAAALGLAIDHDDNLAWKSDQSFALLLHGTQAKGTAAAKALSALRAAGFSGYGPKTQSEPKV